MKNAPTADLPEKTDLHVRTIAICPLDDEMTTDKAALAVNRVALAVNRVALAARLLHRDPVNLVTDRRVDVDVVALAEDVAVEEEVVNEVAGEDSENENLTDTLEIAERELFLLCLLAHFSLE
jgi:hypothetical protein